MRKWFDIRDEAEELRIDIYGPIGKWSWDDTAVSAKDVMDAVGQANGTPITLHVNSEGGSVFDGFAIYTVLRDCPSEVTAYIDGLAASAASYVVMAADEIIMSDVAWMMIHSASSCVWGNKKDFQKEAEMLDGIDKGIAKAYANHSDDLGLEEFLALMEAETWLDAETAKSYGLVDTINEALPAAASLDLYDSQLLDRAPEEARRAVMAMSKKAKSDTSAIINKVDDADEYHTNASEEEALYHVIDGRLFRLEGRKEGTNA